MEDWKGLDICSFWGYLSDFLCAIVVFYLFAGLLIVLAFLMTPPRSGKRKSTTLVHSSASIKTF